MVQPLRKVEYYIITLSWTGGSVEPPTTERDARGAAVGAAAGRQAARARRPQAAHRVAGTNSQYYCT